MKKIISKVKFLWLLAFIFFLSGCGITANKDVSERLKTEDAPVITWGVKVDTNLFGFYNIKKQEIEGFDIDIAKALTDEMTGGKGKPKFVEVTSKTRIPLLKNGNIDAIIATMTITPARAEIVNFSEVYFEAGQSLLVANDSDIQGIDSLTKDHTVLAIKGSSSATNIREKAPQSKILELENYSEAFVALQSGQGDALTTDNAILLGMIAQNPNFRLAGDIFTDEPYGIAVDKSQPGFLKDVDTALQTLRDNGTYDQIYQKWFGGLE